MNLEQIKIYEDDFDMFVLLAEESKIEFLYDAMNTDSKTAMLKQVQKLESIKSWIWDVTEEDFESGLNQLIK